MILLTQYYPINFFYFVSSLSFSCFLSVCKSISVVFTGKHLRWISFWQQLLLILHFTAAAEQSVELYLKWISCFLYQFVAGRSSLQRRSVKYFFLKILQYPQESTCVGVSFLKKLQAFSLQLHLKETPI